MTDSTAPELEPDYEADSMAYVFEYCAPGTEAAQGMILQKGLERANRAKALSADDAVRKAWNTASQKFDSSKGTFIHFFAAILTRKLKTAQRSERRYQNHLAPENVDIPDEAAAEAMASSLARMDRRARRRSVARALRKLSKRDRKLVWLSFWKEQTYSQIVQRPEYRDAGLKVSTCKSRVSRAYAKMRPLLQEWSPRNN